MKSLKFKKKTKKIVLLILILIFGFFLKKISNSLFFKKTERLNIVFFDERNIFYSVDFENNLNYFLSFPNNLKVLVPGGFGYCRIGGLGKLASLLNDPKIYQRTFSSLTNSFIDYYFYPKKDKIYFNNDILTNYKTPDLKKIFFYQSNAGIFDRIYLSLIFLQKKPSDFKIINFLPTIEKNNDIFIDQKKIGDYLKGFFYKNSLRKERANVQLIYSNNYENALLITKIIEGEGIWITDISQLKNQNQKCEIFVSPNFNWLTAKHLNEFFKCSLVKKKINAFDIIIILGELEKDWSVK